MRTDAGPGLGRALLLTLLLARALGVLGGEAGALTGEESLVTWRCARNLAHGLGLLFEPAAAWEPLLSAASPGLGLLLGYGARLGLAPHVLAPALALVCEALALRWWVRRCEAAGRPGLALATGLLWIADPVLARCGLAGGEGSLVLLLGWWAVGALERGRSWPAVLACAAALTVRAEAFFLIPACVLAAPPERRSRSLLLGVGLLAVAGLLGAFAMERFGAAVPEVVRARAVLAGGRPEAFLDAGLRLLGEPPWAFAWVLLAGLGLLRVLRPVQEPGGSDDRPRRDARPATLPAPLLVATLPCLGAIGTLVPAGDPLGVLPRVGLLLLGAHALEPWVARLLRGTATPVRSGHTLRRGIALGLALLVAGGGVLLRRPEARERVERSRAVAAWSRESGWARDGTRLWTTHPGSLGYWGTGSVVDGSGRASGTLWLSTEAPLLLESLDPEWVLLDLERATLTRWLADEARARRWFPVRTFGPADPELDRFPELDRLPVGTPRGWLLLHRRL